MVLYFLHDAVQHDSCVVAGPAAAEIALDTLVVEDVPAQDSKREMEQEQELDAALAKKSSIAADISSETQRLMTV